MRFAVALPWWGYVLAFGLAVLLAWAAYARAGVLLTPAARAWLTALRAAALILVTAALLRPVEVVPSTKAPDRVLPLLIDISRSMRVADDAGVARIEQARRAAEDLAARLGSSYRVERLTFGESLGPAGSAGLLALLAAAAGSAAIEATARQTDLSGALEAVAERFRDERLAGVIVLTDGGDTSRLPADAGRMPPAAVFPIGIGSALV